MLDMVQHSDMLDVIQHSDMLEAVQHCFQSLPDYTKSAATSDMVINELKVNMKEWKDNLYFAAQAYTDGVLLTDKRNWDTIFQRRNSCPFASALLASRVQDFLHQGLVICVFVIYDITSDLNEERFQFTFVPVIKNLDKHYKSLYEFT